MSQQVQPIDNGVYPGNSNGIQPLQQQQQHSSHSNNNGSFGPVFIVLGIIVALTIIATVLGRICSRQRRHRGGGGDQYAHGGGGKKKTAAGGRGKSVKPHDHHFDNQRGGNNNKFQRGGSEGDIEFGFDKKIATSKVADLRGDAHHHHPGGHHHPRGPNFINNVKPWQNNNGESKGHVRFADDHIEFRGGSH